MIFFFFGFYFFLDSIFFVILFFCNFIFFWDFFFFGFYVFWDFFLGGDFMFFFGILFFFGFYFFLGFYFFWILKYFLFFKIYYCLFFSRMRSKGSRFTLGVWGLRLCSLDVAFVVATVRNRPQPFVRTPYGRAYGKFCRGGHFWRFPMRRCFVSRGRRGTS